MNKLSNRFLLGILLIFLICSTVFKVHADTPSAMASSNNIGIGALGYIEPRSRVIRVSHNVGPEGARVAQLFFQESEHVESGQKLALLSDHKKRFAEVDAARTRIKALEAQLAAEKATMAFNQKEYQRYESLSRQSMTTVSHAENKHLAFKQSKLNVQRLLADIDNAKSQLLIAEAELENTIILAPITGTVLKILTRPGERIEDTGLLEMADLSQLDIVAEVYESDLPKVRVGQSAQINAIGFERIYNAEVRELGFQVKKNDLNDTDPLADRDNRIIEVRLTLEPDAVNKLKHQIFRQVRVRIDP
ncbi:MAG: efflux RND transporter periplasmic adaptor subunit [Burkholderiales bacterium]|uniref:HlyD family efflux transporter periplasmic adaptor subunit n=1 Tax=Nitrosomonas sp. TaxID=42353 RepID=UPI001D232426|nr:HlyD family efflux transporter periplasmic adaptor subunit [Nitrosomonas sp.]MCB1949067.1 efflux RND transporter periplasmic adaptor subunit [Nitrosomonas sp.]MCP5244034.1 efflux RND transporter periplasmic adaptor subunit [Burkholderiales bacterium]